MNKKFLLLLLFLGISGKQYGFNIDRVILATDANPLYIDFWPLVAQAWTELAGIRPTLALIADENTPIDETVGDVIRFKPLDNIPTGFQAQVIRLLLPAYFEHDVCLISDIDMLPLCKEYFTGSVKDVPLNKFVVYRNGAYERIGLNDKYPMCYNAALGKTFKEVFKVTSIDDIPAIIQQWYALEYGWNTDELVLYDALNTWDLKDTCLVKLNHLVERRIDRSYWHYDSNAVLNSYYIDSHLLRPYKDFESEIKLLARCRGIYDKC